MKRTTGSAWQAAIASIEMLKKRYVFRRGVAIFQLELYDDLGVPATPSACYRLACRLGTRQGRRIF